MNTIWGIAIAMIYLCGPSKSRDSLPIKGKCPFKDGIMRKLTHHGFILGTEESSVDICGKDSVVLSATNGRVTDVVRLSYTLFITISVDTTVYTYSDIDRSLVQEGQIVKAGQAIAIAREQRIAFFVSNYLKRIFRNPDWYVDCVCELPKRTQ
jgi:hypothetical protein